MARRKTKKDNLEALKALEEANKEAEESNKVISLEEVLKGIEKDFKVINPDIISDPNKRVEFIDSGDFVFNLVVNPYFVGGWPKRRISEIFGPEHCGKSSMLYASFAEVQKNKGLGILIDYEGSWEPIYAKTTFGLVEDRKTFIVFQPDTAEEGDLLYERYSKLPNVDLLAIDSVDAMKPQALIECSLSKEAKIGAHAQCVGRVVGKMRKFAKRKNCAVVFTNQIRAQIITKKGESIQNTGIGFGSSPDDSYTTSGGKPLRYYASLRIKLEYGGQQVDELGTNMLSGEAEKSRIGNMITIMAVKNKVGTPRIKYKTHFDFAIGDNPGGWNFKKDIIYLLKKRGRLIQVSKKLTYVGLNISEWIHSGPKVECEKAFMDNPELIEDGKNLILDLIKKGVNVLDKIQKGDITKEDVEYQESLDPSIKDSIEEDDEDSEETTL